MSSKAEESPWRYQNSQIIYHASTPTLFLCEWTKLTTILWTFSSQDPQEHPMHTAYTILKCFAMTVFQLVHLKCSSRQAMERFVLIPISIWMATSVLACSALGQATKIKLGILPSHLCFRFLSQFKASSWQMVYTSISQAIKALKTHPTAYCITKDTAMWSNLPTFDTRWLKWSKNPQKALKK